MNYRFIYLALVFVLSVSANAQYKLKLKEAVTLVPIPYALVFVDGNFSETNEEGECIVNTNEIKQFLKINHLGYEKFEGYFTFKSGENILYLKSKANVLGKTVVHGHKRLIEKTSIGASIKKEEIKQSTSVSIGDIITKTAGVSTIKTGGTIVKPVIQGLYGNRIVILNNGVVQQGQDWSAEHGTEIDPFIADKIDVIKGAEGVKYGSGALGGVVLISPPKLSYFTNRIKGSIAGILASNGNATTSSAKFEGSGLANRFAWRIQGTKHRSADLKTADYYLNNTGTNSLSFSLNLGYKSKGFGIEGFYSRYQNTYGVTYISEVGNQDDLLERFKQGRPLTVYDPTYKITSPKQAVTHHLLKLNGFYRFMDALKVKTQYSYQQNKRQEFFPRRGGLSNIAAFNTDLKTQNISTSAEYAINSDWESEMGGGYQYQTNENIEGTKIDPTIPNFTSIKFGGFYIQKYQKNALNLSAGIRYDNKFENISGIRKSRRFYNKRKFSNTMFSLSGAYQFQKFSFVSNLGLASRFPHVSEMYSYGLKHGGLFFLTGDKNLTTEKGVKWINSLHYEHPKFYVNVSGFVQRFKNYIYEQPSLETRNLWGGAFVTANYKQSDAIFKGIDANLCIHLSKSWSYYAQGALVHAINLDTNGYFPFIPSGKVVQELKCEKKFGNNFIDVLNFGFNHEFVAKQTCVDTASDLIAITPPSYHLFNLSVGFTSKKINNKQVSVYLSVDNLTNKLYKEYTNRYRYAAHDLGRSINLKTILNF